MLSDTFFIIPNVYSTAGSPDGYSFVSGQVGPDRGYKVLRFTVTNKTSSPLFVQLYDGYNVADHLIGKTPVAELLVAASSQGTLDFSSAHCHPLTKGILLAASSTSWTFTAVASAMNVTAYWIT